MPYRFLAGSNADSAESEWALNAEDFIVLRLLGRGASGSVHLALHIPTLSLCALKVFGSFSVSVAHFGSSRFFYR